METVIKTEWKTQEALLEEFAVLKYELEATYQQDLYLHLEENEEENELIIGFSTRKDGFLYRITTVYESFQDGDMVAYANVNPKWWAKRAEKDILHSPLQSAEEALGVVLESMEMFAEIEMEIEEEESVQVQKLAPIRIRYKFRHPEENNELSKVFTVEKFEDGSASEFIKELLNRGYEVVERTEEKSLLLSEACIRYRDFMQKEHQDALLKRSEIDINQFHNNGKSNGIKLMKQEFDDTVLKVLLG